MSGAVEIELRNDDGRYLSLGSGASKSFAGLGGSCESRLPHHIRHRGLLRPSLLDRWMGVQAKWGDVYPSLQAVDGWGLLDEWRGPEAVRLVVRREDRIAASGLHYGPSRFGFHLNKQQHHHDQPFPSIYHPSRRDCRCCHTATSGYGARCNNLFPLWCYFHQPPATETSLYGYGTDHTILEIRKGSRLSTSTRCRSLATGCSAKNSIDGYTQCL